MTLEPFQTVRGHTKKWHLNRSKPFDGGHLYWLILDHILFLFLWCWYLLTSFDFLLITCHFIFFDVYLMILWCFGHQSNQTSQIKTSKPLGILTQAVPQGEWFWSPRENSLGMMNMNIGISPWSPGILEKSNERVRYHHPPSLPFCRNEQHRKLHSIIIYIVTLVLLWATGPSKSCVYLGRNVSCNVIYYISPALEHELQHNFLHKEIFRTLRTTSTDGVNTDRGHWLK